MQNPHAQSPYARNLVRNYAALEGLKYWETESRQRPEVEESPFGAEPVATCVTLDGPILNWVTSYEYTSMHQLIDLREEGIPVKLLDEQKPPVYTSVLCGTRSDCGAKFRFIVQLLDENKQEVDKFDREKAMEDNLGKWHLIEHVFQDYKPGVRYIRVELGGVDTKFWKGNFGSKFTMPTVRFVFNKA